MHTGQRSYPSGAHDLQWQTMRAIMQAILWRLPRSALNAHGHCMCNASSNKVPAHDRNTMALRDEPHQIDAPQKHNTLSKPGLRKFTLPDAAAAADDVRRACRHIAELPMPLSSEIVTPVPNLLVQASILLVLCIVLASG